MSDSSSERDPLDLLAEEFAERYRRGESPSVSEYVERHPEWAEELRELLPPVAQMEQLKRLKQASGTNGADGPCLEQLGDYRILREVGRGGMGVVYEAVQQSLGRHVALKVLPRHSLLDPKKLQRFRREAQAAAHLHHTNIVPVFGVGEQDGLHYYVMQFIDGQGLDRLVAGWREGTAAGKRRRTGAAGKRASTGSWDGPPPSPADTGPMPSEAEVAPDRAAPGPPPAAPAMPPGESRWRQIARIGAEAAEALHYAHGQGVLHRDVKPGNLLLDPHGAVWVTDFGLAKQLDQEGLTSTGDILGTLQYMAPENFQGRVDARSDVYGLGVTLYELLTLEPPFRGADAAQVLGSVHGQELVPPRKRDPAVPRDLETIVLKATARDPGRRYQSAADLADDLRRFLEDRPIRARRSTAAERLWRWCRRNPVVAGLAAALVVALVGGFAAVFWKWREAEAESRRAEQNLRRAEANEELSLRALEEIFDNLAQREVFPPFPQTPGGFGGKGAKGGKGKGFQGGKFGGWAPGGPRQLDSEEDAALLQSILKFYDQFAEQNATNAKLQREAAHASRRVGDIQRRLGRNNKAEEAYRRAAALLERLVENVAEASPRDRREWAETYTSLEVRATQPAELREVETRLRRALTIAGAPAGPRWGGNVLPARAQERLAIVLQRQGRMAEAEAAYREAVRLRKAPAPFWEVDLCAARQALAAFLLERGRPADARDVLQESIADLKRWNAWGPTATLKQKLLREQYQSLATAWTGLGETARAAEASREADRIGQQPPPFGKGGRPGKGPRS
jgi:eukaryotic-like serine/threonine-protein kinase